MKTFVAWTTNPGKKKLVSCKANDIMEAYEKLQRIYGTNVQFPIS